MLKLTIKNPAPDDDSQNRWGDFHFGNALQRSMEAKGVTVFQDFQPNWSNDHDEDVILVLRGLSKFQPLKTKFTILWIISHPVMVTPEELDAYDLVLTVSAFHRDLLRRITKAPVEVARQCTDFGSFYPFDGSPAAETKTREGIVYVANSRGQRREMAQWIEETHAEVRVFGRAWEKFGIGRFVEKEYIPNADLPKLYRSARLCLNDHWKDMRAFGFINNRIFDSLACGLPILTDSFPEIRALFGNTLLYARNAEEFRNKIAFCETNYEEILGRVRETWNEIGASYTFDARADDIIHWIQAPPARGAKRRDSDAEIRQGDFTYTALQEFVKQEEEKTAYLEKLIINQTRLADQARREAIWARDQKEEEKRSKEKERRSKEEFYRMVEKAERKIEWMTDRINTQEQAKNQLQYELKVAKGRLSDLEISFQKEKKLKLSLFGYAKSLRNELETIYKSRSWKIGAPYRIVARAVYGLLRGKKMGKTRIPDWPTSIIELDGLPGVSNDALKFKKSQPDAFQKLPTGSLQNPLFADQVFGASTVESGTKAALKRNYNHIYYKIIRLPWSLRHQFQQILFPIKRRLSSRSAQALKGLLSRVGVKTTANTIQQSYISKSTKLEANLPDLEKSGIQAQPSSQATALEMVGEFGYWHEKALQLLDELEAIQEYAGQKRSLLSKWTLQKEALHKTEALSFEVGNQADCGINDMEYWRSQASHLHEELEYARANLKKK